MEKLHIEIEGVSPLLMHSTRAMNRRDPLVQRKALLVSKKTRKTEADIDEIEEIDYHLAFYLNQKDEPYLPSEFLEASINSGARKLRKGKEFLSGFMVDLEGGKLIYDGPKNPAKLFENDDFVHRSTVVVSRARTPRIRPMFMNWKCEFVAYYNPSIINLEDVKEAIIANGMQTGMGDWRPKYGRFNLAKIDVLSNE